MALSGGVKYDDQIVIRVPNTAAHRSAIRDLATMALNRRHDGHHDDTWIHVCEALELSIQPEHLESPLVPAIDTLHER